MLRRTGLFACGLAALVMSACAATGPTGSTPDELYLAVKVEQHGRPVGTPRLLGFEGKRIFAEKWTPGAPLPDYRLLLKPNAEAGGYGVWLDLELPSGRSSGRVGLLHGEERTIALDGETKLTLLVMRVDSPEFRALMKHGSARAGAAGTI